MTSAAARRPAATPLLDGRKSATEQALVIGFMVVPLLALAAAVPLAWGWGLTWRFGRVHSVRWPTTRRLERLSR